MERRPRRPRPTAADLFEPLRLSHADVGKNKPSVSLQCLPERVNHTGIELPTSLSFDLRQRIGDRPGLLIGPHVDKSIEGVSHGHDPGRQGDFLSSKPTRISPTVPTLVMGSSNLLSHLHEGRSASPENPGPMEAMLFHRSTLLGRERSLFQQDFIADSHLAHVVKRGCLQDESHLIRGKSQFLSKECTESRHTTRVPPSGVISYLRHLGQAFDHLLLRALCFCGTSLCDVLSGQIALSQSLLQETRVKEGIDMEQEVLDMDRFDQEILGPSLDGPLSGLEVVKSAYCENGKEHIRRALATDGFQQPVPVKAGHANIERDEIGIGGVKILYRPRLPGHTLTPMQPKPDRTARGLLWAS